jgi:hypothetical protein
MIMRGKTITVSRKETADAAGALQGSVPELAALRQDLAALHKKMAKLQTQQIQNTWSIIAVAVIALGALILVFVT